jgi:hypothetical protein
MNGTRTGRTLAFVVLRSSCFVQLAAIVLLFTTLTAAAQDAGRWTLRGVLVDAASGGPLPRARVNVTAGRTKGAVGLLQLDVDASVLTDGDGRFSADVPMGASPTIRIVKAGYASMTVPVSADQVRGPDPLRIEVPRGGVIAGRAVDPLGVPAFMIAVRRVTPDGNSWTAFLLVGGVLETGMAGAPDERGEYRVGGLPPGRYVVEAYPSGMNYQIKNGPSGVDVRAVASSFDPSTVPIPVTSVTVDLEAGGEATGVDLILAPSPSQPSAPDPAGATIRGIVSSTDGVPLADATVMAGPPGAPFAARSTRTDAFGRFALRGVGHGPVTVRASRRGYGQAQPGQRGGDLPGQTLTIEAGKDVDDLSIVLPRLGSALSVAWSSMSTASRSRRRPCSWCACVANRPVRSLASASRAASRSIPTIADSSGCPISCPAITRSWHRFRRRRLVRRRSGPSTRPRTIPIRPISRAQRRSASSTANRFTA